MNKRSVNIKKKSIGVNSHNTIEFYPYKGNKYALILLLPITIIGIITDIYFLINGNDFFTVLLVGIILIVYSVIQLKLYVDSKTAVILNEEGVRLRNTNRKVDVCVLWNAIKYCYYCSNWHNNRYIVFSEKELTKKEVKKIVNRISNESVKRLYYHKTMIIPYSVFEKELIEKIQDIISERVQDVLEIT